MSAENAEVVNYSISIFVFTTILLYLYGVIELKGNFPLFDNNKGVWKILCYAGILIFAGLIIRNIISR